MSTLGIALLITGRPVTPRIGIVFVILSAAVTFAAVGISLRLSVWASMAKRMLVSMLAWVVLLPTMMVWVMDGETLSVWPFVAIAVVFFAVGSWAIDSARRAWLDSGIRVSIASLAPRANGEGWTAVSLATVKRAGQCSMMMVCGFFAFIRSWFRIRSRICAARYASSSTAWALKCRKATSASRPAAAGLPISRRSRGPAGDWLREHGARPFLFPAMGSHNGGTAEGQREMIESLGITEEAMGMPIRASMDVVKLGTVSTGDVWMDRIAYESDGVLVLNRIKLHTCFAGPVQSGLTKMIVVGMGKTPSATTFHSAPTPQMKEMLLEMGQVVLDSGKIWAGLAILEDGFDQTAELHAVRPADILQARAGAGRAPPPLLPAAAARSTSTCWSSTRSARRSAAPAWTRTSSATAASATAKTSRSPSSIMIAALSLAAASHGNAIGVGLADFITRRLRDAIDEQKTFLNSFTTGHMGRVKIPITFRDDEELFEMLAGRYGDKGWIVIPNTLHLETLYASEDLRDELAANPICEIEPQSIELSVQRRPTSAVVYERIVGPRRALISRCIVRNRQAPIAPTTIPRPTKTHPVTITVGF